MGVIYLCSPENDPSRKLVLKELRLDPGEEPEIRAVRFKRKPELLPRLYGHKHITIKS